MSDDTTPTIDQPQIDNPAAGINPGSLDELMSRDPLELGQRDLAAIVTQLRRMREAWKQELDTTIAAGPKPRKARAPAAPKQRPSLEDLGL